MCTNPNLCLFLALKVLLNSIRLVHFKTPLQITLQITHLSYKTVVNIFARHDSMK